MSYHAASVHTGNIIFPCYICNKQFPSKNELNNHIQWDHEKTVQKIKLAQDRKREENRRRNREQAVLNLIYQNQVQEQKIQRKFTVNSKKYSQESGKALDILSSVLDSGSKGVKKSTLKELSKYTNMDLVNSLEREKNLNKNLAVQHHKIDEIKCENLDEALQSENGLKSHASEVHEEEMPYKCLLCKAGFAKIEEITTHMNSFHEKKSSNVYTNQHIQNSKIWYSTF